MTKPLSVEFAEFCQLTNEVIADLEYRLYLLELQHGPEEIPAETVDATEQEPVTYSFAMRQIQPGDQVISLNDIKDGEPVPEDVWLTTGTPPAPGGMGLL